MSEVCKSGILQAKSYIKSAIPLLQPNPNVIFTYAKYVSLYFLRKLTAIHSSIETDRTEIYTTLF